MRNKELLLRRVETLEGKLKRMRNALNELNVDAAREILQEIIELNEDIHSIVERED
jgi:hypothetical protein